MNDIQCKDFIFKITSFLARCNAFLLTRKTISRTHPGDMTGYRKYTDEVGRDSSGA